MFVCALCLGLLLFWLRQIWWREQHGWWVYRPVTPPNLPVQLSGVGWNAAFDSDEVRVQNNFGRDVHVLAYAKIEFVDAAIRGQGAREIFVAEHGAMPLTLRLRDDELMAVLALLAQRAPQI